MSHRFLISGSLVLCLFLSVGSLYPSPRILRIRVLGDVEFRQDADWKSRAEQAVHAASDDFQRLFDIGLSIEAFEAWESPASLRSLDLLAFDLEAKVNKAGADVLLAFTARKTLGKKYSGYTLARSGVIVLQDDEDPSRLAKVLKHESAHLFGAVHLEEESSLMDTLGRGRDFDAVTSSLIRLNRNRSFNPAAFPIPRENWEKAIEIYKRIAAEEKFSERRAGRDLEDVHLILAQIYAENKQYDEAIAECRKALKLDPTNPETLNQQGIALRRKGLIEEAIEQYQKSLKIRPGQAQVWYNLGIAHSNRGDLGASTDCYRKAIELKPHYAEAMNNLGELFLRQEKGTDAEKQFRQAVFFNPEYGLARSNLAEALFRRGDLAMALEEADKAIACDPGLAGPRCIKGKVLRERGDLDRALQEFEAAVAVDPMYEKAYYNLGLCFLDKNSVAEARTHFLKAVEIKSRFAEAYAGLGYCDLVTGQSDEAVRELRLALELGARSAKTHLNLSSAYLYKNLPDQAILEADRALELEPNLAPAFNNKGMALLKMGRDGEAIEYFERTIAHDPKNKDALLNLGNINLGLARLDAALEFYARALETDPNNALVHNNIAVVFFRKGDFRAAWEHVQKAGALGFKIHPDFLKALKEKIKDTPGARPGALET